MAQIFKKLKPWIEKNGVIGHHDFHINNCILSKKRAYIIDWTTAAPLSDPYNDVASFANILKPEQRLELLQTYLQKSTLSPEEKAHFRLCEITSYARIAALCFSAQRKTKLPDAVTKACIEKVMEAELDSNVLSDRSFLEVPYAIHGEKLRARGMLALQEFLDLSHEIPGLLAELP